MEWPPSPLTWGTITILPKWLVTKSKGVRLPLMRIAKLTWFYNRFSLVEMELLNRHIRFQMPTNSIR